MDYLLEKDSNLPEKYQDISFIPFQELKPYIFGAPFMKEGFVEKIEDIDSVLKENDYDNLVFLKDTNIQTSGVRLRITTDSTTLVIKASLKRSFAHQKALLCNTSGFDVYQIKSANKYDHLTVVAPDEGHSKFIHMINIQPNIPLEIYFPNYNKVEDISLGISNGKTIKKAPDYILEKPIVFYGHSVTQGASASRSGNAYPNIVSRKMNANIINFSFSAACRAEIAMAKQIVSHPMSGFIMDYSRNAKNLNEFITRYEPFYQIIRDANPGIPIVLVGGFCMEKGIDEYISDFFKKRHAQGENIFFLNLTKLFKDIPLLFLSMDKIHYTDVGMQLVAERIVEFLSRTNM